MSATEPVRWARVQGTGYIGETDRHYVELVGERGRWTLTVYPATFKQGVAVKGGAMLEERTYNTKPEALRVML